MERIRQLKDTDVRNDAEELNPSLFLRGYLKSNFPQTEAHPSPGQKSMGGQRPVNGRDSLDFKKKFAASSGTSFDRPQAY